MLFQWRALRKGVDQDEFLSIVVTAKSTEEARVLVEKVARNHRVWALFKKPLQGEPDACVLDDNGLLVYGD